MLTVIHLQLTCYYFDALCSNTTLKFFEACNGGCMFNQSLYTRRQCESQYHKRWQNTRSEQFINRRKFPQPVKKLSTFCRTSRFLPCSQQPATKPYPEPDESSTRPYILLFSSILILFSTLRLDFPSAFFASSFAARLCMNFQALVHCATSTHIVISW